MPEIPHSNVFRDLKSEMFQNCVEKIPDIFNLEEL